jgi:hypothetical protein
MGRGAHCSGASCMAMGWPAGREYICARRSNCILWQRICFRRGLCSLAALVVEGARLAGGECAI